MHTPAHTRILEPRRQRQFGSILKARRHYLEASLSLKANKWQEGLQLATLEQLHIGYYVATYIYSPALHAQLPIGRQYSRQ